MLHPFKWIDVNRRVVAGLVVAVLVLVVLVARATPESFRSELEEYLGAAKGQDPERAGAVVCPESASYVAAESWRSDLANLGRIEGFTIKRGSDQEAWFDVDFGGDSQSFVIRVDRSHDAPCLLIRSGTPLGTRRD